MKSLFKKTTSFLAFFVCLISSTFAQLPDSKGTDFHVAFPPNYSSGARLELFISSETASVVTLTSAHTGYSHTVTTVPGTVSTVSLPNSFEVTNYQTIQNKGIHIVSDNEVTVYGLNAIRYSTDAFMGLPTDILGTEYIISSYKGLGASYPSMATVVGAEDGTVVTFLPTNAVGSNAAGVPFSVTVNKGQTYAIAATTGARDLTGTIITSSKPLAVYGSVKCTNVPSNCSACDHVVEQMTPVSSWGKSFVTAPLASRKNGDIFRFIASVDGTSITVNGSVVVTINRGQFHERLITGNAEITSTEPILVAQFSRGQSCDGVVADPFMMLIPPYEQFLASYTIATPASGFSKHFINLVVPQIAIGDVKLDGVVIPSGRFAAVGTSGFYTAQLTVTAGSHTIDGNYPVGVHSYGFGSYDSYGYAGGQSLSPIGFVNSISLSPANGGSSEVATQHCVEATVLDQFSNAVEGVRVDFNVTGANTLTGFGFTNASGVAQYCYNGAATGTDAIVATTGSLTSNSGSKDWTCANIAIDVAGRVCVGGSDNQISFGAVSGGVAPYSYSTDNGTTFGSSSVVSGLSYGTYSVVVKDAANCLSAAKDVVLQDVVPPTAVCQNVSVQLDANGSYALTAVEVDNGSTDNCTLASLSLSPSSFTCDNTGSNSVILTATDNSGNSSTCTAEITVLDDTNPCCEGPVANAKDITISLDDDGVASLTATQIDNGSTADCGLQTMTVSSTSFTCDNMGENTVTLTVTDVNGVVSTSTAVVTVIDDTKPVLVCQNVTRVLDETGHLQFNPLVDGAVVSRTDNCKTKGHVGFTGPKHYYCPQVGDHNITIYQQDQSNNQTSCQVVLTIVDDIAPVALCKDITVQLDASGNASIVAADVDGGSSDVCEVSLSIDNDQFTCANVGVNNVVLTATDPSGNASSCTVVVTVEDNVAPNAIGQDLNLSLDAIGNVSISASDVDNGSNDNCGISSLSIVPSSFTCANVGSNEVVLTVTDVNGNVSTTTSNVVVNDVDAPVVVCKDITVQLDENGSASIVAADVDNGSSDNCGIASMEVFPNTFSCPQEGAQIPVTLTVTDVNGNVSTCVANVEVDDKILPTAVCKNITVDLDQNGAATIVPNDVNGASFDNCGWTRALWVSNESFDCSNVGENTVTMKIGDGNGNQNTCEAVVTIVDNVAPLVVTQDLSIDLDNLGNVSISASDVDNGSSDACGVASVSVTPNVFNCSNVGDNEVVLTVTDVNGNVSTGTANVNVSDVTAPIAIAQDLVVELDANGFASITTTDADNGSNDACGIASLEVSPSEFDCSNTGSNVATLTATDVNGNVSTVEFNVAVKDVIAPSITCPSTVVVCDEQAAVWEEPYTDDNCSVISVVSDYNSGTIFPVGTSTVSYVVTDASGNTAECSFDVIVNPLPEVNITQSEQSGFCQGGAVVLSANSTTAASYLWDDLSTEQTNKVYSSGVYEVTVTDENGCSQSSSTEVDYKQTELLSNYVIVAKNRFHLYEDQISCGGAGIMDASGISQIYGGPLKQFKSPFTVSPWYANHTIKIEPFASTWFDIDNVVDGNSNVNLPTFEETNNAGHAGNIYVYPGQTVVLTQSKYGIVNVFAGGTLIIDNADIHMESLTTGYGGADVIFNKCSTKLHIKTTWTSYPDVQFNADGKSVVVFIGPDQWNGFDRTYFWGGNAVINASIYTKGLIRTYNMGPGKIMEMNGLFIAKEVYSMGNVEWSCATTCSSDCGEESNKRDEYVEGLQDGSAEAPSNEVAEIVEIDMFPNPSKGLITLGNVETFKTIKFFDAKGSLVKEVLNAQGAQMLQVSMDDQANGVYTVVFTGSTSVQQAKVVITK